MKVIIWLQSARRPLLLRASNIIEKTYGSFDCVGMFDPNNFTGVGGGAGGAGGGGRGGGGGGGGGLEARR